MRACASERVVHASDVPGLFTRGSAKHCVPPAHADRAHLPPTHCANAGAPPAELGTHA